MRPAFLAISLLLVAGEPVRGQVPFDFIEATALLEAQRSNLSNRVAVLIYHGGQEVYSHSFGDIGYDTKTRLASFTKTISAIVILRLADQNLIDLNAPVGSYIPVLNLRGLGAASTIQCFGMCHGIKTPIAYEIDPRIDLEQSVNRIAATGTLLFQPGQQLDYDGPGMQIVGRIAELQTATPWEQIARQQIFDPLDMPQADYGYFAPNPAVAGGARSTARETIQLARMVIAGGEFNGQPILTRAGVERLFTNATFQLPVHHSPWPEQDPDYPYGARPDYAFGAWVLAQNPLSGHVEEIVGAGAWGSYIWMDRRRGLAAVLITDVPAGWQASMRAALGLFSIARQQTDALQLGGLQIVTPADGSTLLRFSRPPGASAVRIYGAHKPIRSTLDLHDATVLVSSTTQQRIAVPAMPHYAATAIYGNQELLALVPRSNTLAMHCRADLNRDGTVHHADLSQLLEALGPPRADHDTALQHADLDDSGSISSADLAILLSTYASQCP